MKLDRGYIKLHRSILDSALYGDTNCFKLFIHLMLRANYKDSTYRGDTIKSGSMVTGRNILSIETGLTQSQVRTAVNKLQRIGELNVTKKTLYSVYALTKWDISDSSDIGYIKVHRSMLDWEWYSDINCFRAFLHLMLTASHKGRQWKGGIIESGSTLTSQRKLSAETGLTERQVRTALEKLQQTNELKVLKHPLTPVYQLVKWGEYQNTSKALNKRHRNDAVTTQERRNNDATLTADLQSVTEVSKNEVTKTRPPDSQNITTSKEERIKKKEEIKKEKEKKEKKITEASRSNKPPLPSYPFDFLLQQCNMIDWFKKNMAKRDKPYTLLNQQRFSIWAEMQGKKEKKWTGDDFLDYYISSYKHWRGIKTHERVLSTSERIFFQERRMKLERERYESMRRKESMIRKQENKMTA